LSNSSSRSLICGLLLPTAFLFIRRLEIKSTHQTHHRFISPILRVYTFSFVGRVERLSVKLKTRKRWHEINQQEQAEESRRGPKYLYLAIGELNYPFPSLLKKNLS